MVKKKTSSRAATIRKRISQRIEAFKKRRPHRSFQLSRRRDYFRSLELPGYWEFTKNVWQMIWERRKVFALVIITYTFISIVLGLMANQTVYSEIGDLFKESGSELASGEFDSLSQALLLSVATFSGSTQSLSEAQQIYAVLLFLLTWLTTTWLLREFLAGGKPRLRDGLYNASAPLISTFLVFGVMLLQLIPMGILGVAYTALTNINVLSNGMPIFVFSVLALLVLALTLYWLTATFIALVVVTLPGMYPLQALRTAGDLVIGRRLRILYRLLWLLGSIAVVWFVIMLPFVLIDSWLVGVWSGFSSVPIVPVIAILLGSVITVWASSYIYLLYRKVIDDEAAPA